MLRTIFSRRLLLEARPCQDLFQSYINVLYASDSYFEKLGLHLLLILAPIEEDMNIKYHDVEFNNTLLRSNIYREDPSPEVDQAWQDLGVRCELKMTDICVR